MKKIIYMLIIITVLSSAFGIFLPVYLSVASNNMPVEITIPPGSALNYISELLYNEGIIRSKAWFKYKAKEDNIDRNIKPGTYILAPNITLDEIFKMLVKGPAETPVILTIPEGFTLYQIAKRVEALGFGTREDFIEAANGYFRNKGHSLNENELYYLMEGYLYPDTYHFTKNQTIEDIIGRLAQQMDSVFTEEYINRAEELGFTVHEVLTIASLIEREAYNNKERAAISGVIHNRLEINMPLQIDASVIYGIGEGREHVTQVLYSHLEENNPFNTYKINGLPPGPIAAPGKASIHAALYPEDHDYLYYVLGENGHVFSRTYEEHLRNVANFRQMVNQSQ